jgi:hypothetical protein
MVLISHPPQKFACRNVITDCMVLKCTSYLQWYDVHTKFRENQSTLSFGCPPIQNFVKISQLWVLGARPYKIPWKAVNSEFWVPAHTKFRKNQSTLNFGCPPIQNSVKISQLWVLGARPYKISWKSVNSEFWVPAHTKFRENRVTLVKFEKRDTDNRGIVQAYTASS